jgi:hypothetical protein
MKFVQAALMYVIIIFMPKTSSFNDISSYYTEDNILAKDLDIDSLDSIKIWRLSYEPGTLSEANDCFSSCGAVLLPANFSLSANHTVARLIEPVRLGLLEKWQTGQLDSLTKTKNYVAYNMTERHMRTIAYPDVCKDLPEIITLQKSLLPFIKTIAGDSETEISTDSDEGTVVNLQVFTDQANKTTSQQHGAHSDRVDTTAVVTLENIGPHGDLVFIDNYAESCEELGLDQHQDFNQNLKEILKTKPQSIRFRVHKTSPGTIVIVRTDKDIHFITSKSSEDVLLNITPDENVLLQNNSQILGRGIINMAFETKHCREVDRISKEIESKFDFSSAHQDYNDFFKKLNSSLENAGLEKEMKEAVRGAIITRVSAQDLYGEN